MKIFFSDFYLISMSCRVENSISQLRKKFQMSSTIECKNGSKQKLGELNNTNDQQSGELKKSIHSEELKIVGEQDANIKSYSEQHSLRLSADNGEPFPKKRDSNKRSIRKCLRKDSRICYTDLEGITVLKKIPERGSLGSVTDPSDQEINENNDSYRSGESIFKTFTFEQTSDINDQETLKCIEFWKSVMKRNLAPIKCTLMEKNHKSEKQKMAEPSFLESEMSEREYQENRKGKDEEALRIWSEAIKEIRRKKLDQVKLYYTERCKYCKDPFTKDLMDELGVPNKEDMQDEISGLTDWEPEKTQSLDKEESNKLTSKIISGTSRRSFVETKGSKISFKTSKEAIHRPSSKPASINLGASPRKSALKHSIQSNKPLLGSEDDQTSGSSPVLVASTSVQAPVVKCTCDVESCTCPHRAAERNSISSFVESARKSMLKEDKSVVDFSASDADPCICAKIEEYPWLQVTCNAEPCISKSPEVKIQGSSSDFNLDKILGRGKHSPCVCRRYTNVICPSNECHFKESQGSLIQGFPDQQEDKIESTPSISKSEECLCENNTPDIPAPPKEKPPKCTCNLNLPWSQAICRSWSCPYRKMPRRKADNDDEKIKNLRLPIIEDASSTCICGKHVWQQVECTTEECTKVTKKRKSDQITRPSRSSLKHATPSRESRRKTISEEKMAEKIKPKISECACSTSPPWLTAKCTSPYCSKKIAQEDASVQSLEPTILVENNENDKPELISVDYSTCICSKEEQENEHFKCTSEECKMKTVDKTCECETVTGIVCKNKTCKTKLKASKLLKRTQDPIKHRPKCTCKVRGYPTTKDVNCVSPDCPFAKKKTKKKSVPLFIRTPQTNCRDDCQFSDACRGKKEATPTKLKDVEISVITAPEKQEICKVEVSAPSTYCKICGRYNCGH